MPQNKQVPVKPVFSIFADIGVDIQGEERGSPPYIYREIVCCITDVSHNVTVATSHAGGCNNLQWECRYPIRSGRTHCTVPVWFPAWTQESKYSPPPRNHALQPSSQRTTRWSCPWATHPWATRWTSGSAAWTRKRC